MEDIVSNFYPPKVEQDYNNRNIQQNSAVSEPNNILNNFEEEDYSFEGTARNMDKEGAKARRNLIIGSLLGLSAMISPFVCSEFIEDEPYYSAGVENVISENDKNIIERAQILAKGGKDSTYLESQEFDNLLNFSELESLPRLTGENIKVLAKSGFVPISTKEHDSDKKILNRVKEVQYYIDSAVKHYKENPPKSSAENYYEYCIKNVTDQEILDNVDFSELSMYQSDLSLIKHSIRMNRKQIRRDDIDVAKKTEAAINEAQQIVDDIVRRYKIRAKVSGNVDGNTMLTESELLNLLNLSNIRDLPYQLQIGIVRKALEGYTPRSLSHVNNDKSVEFENRMVKEDVKKAQEILDEWTFKARKEFAHLINTDNNQVLIKRYE